MSQASAIKSKSAREAISQKKIEEIEAVSQKLFGKLPRRVAFPGGKSRDAFVADIDGMVCVFASREDEGTASLEARVLKAFTPTAHAPKFLARHKNWIVQECVPGIRLPVMVDQAGSMNERERLIVQSLDALLELHEAARKNGLQHSLRKIGSTDRWLDKKVKQGDIVSEKLGLVNPEFDRGAVKQVLDVKHKDFVKRDARPGNAMIFEDRCYWFDFEDCGRRRALDDLIWVMCDEWTSLDEEAEARIIEQFFSRFSHGLEEEEARLYFHIYGVMHMMWRLRLIVQYHQEDSKWWDRSMCLAKDKIGITSEEAGRICWRAKRWAAREQLLAHLPGWFDDVIEKLDLEDSANISSLKI